MGVGPRFQHFAHRRETALASNYHDRIIFPHIFSGHNIQLVRGSDSGGYPALLLLNSLGDIPRLRPGEDHRSYRPPGHENPPRLCSITSCPSTSNPACSLGSMTSPAVLKGSQKIL